MSPWHREERATMHRTAPVALVLASLAVLGLVGAGAAAALPGAAPDGRPTTARTTRTARAV